MDFPPESPVFHHPQKTKTKTKTKTKKKPSSPNSNSTRIEGLDEDQLMWLRSLNILILIFTFFLHQRSSGFTWTKIAEMLLILW